MNKKYHIEFFRKNGFNCFPIPKYPDTFPNPKAADSRFDAGNTKQNQIISENENYGIIPLRGEGTAIIDLDHKERYRKFAENMVKDGYMVIETPNGWHIPVIGLSGKIQKVKLYDYSFQPDKQIIEIQGPEQYVIGCGSEIFNKKTQSLGDYKNIGTEIIWNAKGNDFHKVIDIICKNCDVTSQKKTSRSSYKNLRDRFKEGKVPTKGSSNDYFFQAALQCNTDGLTVVQATENIKIIYDQWVSSDTFSGRPWQNIEAKIADVYENNLKLEEGRPKGGGGEVDRTLMAQHLIEDRKLYSNVKSGELFENQDGFLENIDAELQRELQKQWPVLAEADYNDILFKLRGLAEPIPPTNKDLIVFKNGIYDIKKKTLVESDEIADMGFKQYNYLECHPENRPVEFIKCMFDNVPEIQHPRIKAGLKAILTNYLDPKISVIYGESGVGKSTPLVILVGVLGEQYAYTVDLQQYMKDNFIKAGIFEKRLVVFQDLPKDWKDFTTLKTMTGEQRKTERGFMKDKITFDNKIKIWASGNYLSEIPEEEKNAMYTRRLSLIHNVRKEPYDEDPELADRIIKNEGEKIISWILNIPHEDCKYEDKTTVQDEWEGIASPEINFLKNFYEINEEAVNVSVSKILLKYYAETKKRVPFNLMVEALTNMGYSVKQNIITNIKDKKQNEELSKEEPPKRKVQRDED